MEAYYYEQLDKYEKSVYYQLRAGLQTRQAAIEVPRTDGRTLSDLYFLLRLDHPELFYSAAFQYRVAPGADTVTVLPGYLFDRKKLVSHSDAMRARCERLIRPVRDKTEEEKLLYIHDFICGNVRYDKLKKEYSHEILGPLGQSVGVCEGIAKSVKLLCDALGVWCIVAVSDNNPEKGIKYRHTWNVVRLEGKYYHLDATFDNSLGEPEDIRYDYFLLSDKQHFRDHEPVIWPVPACGDGDRFYYKTRRLSLTKPEDVRRRAAQALKKNRPLTFHWRGGYLTRETLILLAELLQAEADAAGRTVRIRVNRPQAVFRVIPEAGSAGPLVLENANEGEEYGPGPVPS